MKTKVSLLFSLLIIASLALTACGPAATQAPVATEAAGATTITIWHQLTGDYLTAIEQVFKDYEASHPNVTIELSKPEDVTAALQVAVPAGEGPDILQWANDQIGKNALVGNIVALDDYGIDQAFLTSTYEPAAVQGVVWQDKIWALPETQEGIAFVYNQDLVTEEYLPSDPTDFEDILAKAQKFYEDTGMPLFCNQGFKGGDAYHIGAVFFGFGVPSYVDDQGNVAVDTPEAVEAMNWLLDVKPYMFQEADDEACRTAVKEGKAGGQWGGPWLLADFEGAGVNYGVAPMGKPFVGIKVVMLTKNAVDRGNQEVALDIMKYYTSPEVQAKLALVNKTIPAQTAALADPEVAALPSLAGFGTALNLGVPMANTPFADAQWGPVGDAVGAIWNGSQTPEEALAAAQTAIEAKVAEMQ
ncbi:MAG TPA: extracellular solute-binding protein [Anaerolineales bacterium]|nr:extracellular solute-binding protein [Anaerolineales bacterium]